MGSLMAGWDSPVPDDKAVKFQRNKSLTKEEIEAFWKSKKRKEEEHLREISALSPRSQEQIKEKLFPLLESETSLDKLLQKNGWWISSTSAFLNEPPVIASDGSNQKYKSQYHVANLAKEHVETGIGA
ncbi:uncharacterized protein LOC111374527 [Olea europaea var. sylvestris]|uniref:uncharacterized protein LOC111374527 n=1 Tax=Olea europaea var. sylvestris TaxID=158386 RepID=UPI000C1D63F7|nr:uncharacterized protein LOC111374527 [Olea europaea var. sylvestris]